MATSFLVLCKYHACYNPSQNILKLFHHLPKLFLTTSETEVNYYPWQLNVRVALRVAERHKTNDLRKLRNFRKISKLAVDIA